MPSNSKPLLLLCLAASAWGQQVSVKDFQAKGDGIADDTAAIQAALNTRRLVFLPAGIYKISELTISQDMQGLSGEGIASQLQASGHGVALTVTGQYHILQNFFLNGGPEGLGGIQFGDAASPAAFTRMTGVQVRGFTHPGAFGVGLYAVQELNIQDCPLDGNFDNVAVPGGGHAYVTSTVIGGAAGHIGNALHNGISIRAEAGEITLRDAVIESNALEDILVSNGVKVTRLILDSCYFEGGNKSGGAQALIAIRGKPGRYQETSLVMRGNIFHMPARKTPALYLDHAISLIGGNLGIFETGGVTATGNSTATWMFNHMGPSAANLRDVYAALGGSNYVLDGSYGESAFELGPLRKVPGDNAAAPVWGRYSVRKIAGGWRITDPRGQVSTQSAPASAVQQIALFTLPANGFVSHARIATVTPFSGPASVSATVGFSTAPAALIAAYDLTKAPSAPNLADGAGFGSNNWRAEQNCVLAISSGGKNLDQIAPGAEVAVWIEWAVLP